MIAIAQPNLAAGVELAAEAVKQYQDYLTQLQPILGQAGRSLLQGRRGLIRQ